MTCACGRTIGTQVSPEAYVQDGDPRLCGWCRTKAAGGRKLLREQRREERARAAAAVELAIPPDWDLPTPRPNRERRVFSRGLSNDLWRELTSVMFGAGAPS